MKLAPGKTAAIMDYGTHMMIYQEGEPLLVAFKLMDGPFLEFSYFLN